MRGQRGIMNYQLDYGREGHYATINQKDVKSQRGTRDKGYQQGQRGAKNQLLVDEGQDKDQLRGYEDNDGDMQQSTI